MITKDYIEAAHKALSHKNDTESVLEALRRSLKYRGYTKLYPTILRGLIRKYDLEQKRNCIVITTARTEDFAKHKHEIEDLLREVEDGGVRKEVIDETLIGGFTIRSKEKHIDRSYKQALLAIYKRVTD